MAGEKKLDNYIQMLSLQAHSLGVTRRTHTATGVVVEEVAIMKGQGSLPRVAFIYGNVKGYASLIPPLLKIGFKFTAACGSGITMYQHDGLSDADLLTVKEMLERLESLIYKAQEKRRPELSLFEIA